MDYYVRNMVSMSHPVCKKSSYLLKCRLYASTKLLSFNDNGTCKYSETSFYFSPMRLFHTNTVHYFLVPMKCPHKQHTTVADAMSTQCHFTSHAQNCWS